MQDDVACVWDGGALLGEGPVWLAAEQALWFTDIKGRRLHRYTPRTGTCEAFPVPAEVGFLVPAEGGGLVAGMDHALHRVRDGRLAGRIAGIPASAHTRINDGTVDRAGRIWFGTMHVGETDSIGAVHVHDGRGEVREAGGHAIVTNGPAISADGTLLYHADTVAGLVWRFRIAGTDVLRDGAIFARIDPADGYPDGLTMDAQGCVWVALWGGHGVRRYAPDGTLIGSVRLPVSRVTKLAFGDNDLRTAYVTTARIGLTQAALAAEPLAGGLFAFDPGVAGLPLIPARLPPKNAYGLETQARFET